MLAKLQLCKVLEGRVWQVSQQPETVWDCQKSSGMLGGFRMARIVPKASAKLQMARNGLGGSNARRLSKETQIKGRSMQRVSGAFAS